MEYVEGSAKTGERIDGAIREMVKEVVRRKARLPMKDIFMTFLFGIDEDMD